MKQCPNCGAQIADNSRFCSECGKEIPQETVCPHCGASVNEGDAFCQNCGKKPTDTPTETNETVYEGEKKSGFKKNLPYIFGTFVVLVIIGYFNFKDSKGGDDSQIAAVDTMAVDSTTVDEVILEQKMICAFEDIVEFQNLMQGCSGLTSQAKSNYQKSKPSIEEIAKRNGFTIYEYHYVNGDLGQGEMSSYCCYLFKNCSISKNETGYPTFTPISNGVGCVLSNGEITVYDRDSYDELVRHIKERCENKLYSEIEGDGEDIYYYSDGKYCYYMDCIGSGEYRIPIHKQIDENNGATETNDLDWLQGHWIYEQGSYKGHFIIQGDKLIQYSSMNSGRDEATFTIDGDVLRASFSANDNIVVKIDHTNQRIDYGDGQWMHKVDSSNDSYSSRSSSNSSSSRTFQSEQMVIGYLTNQSFYSSDGLIMKVDGSGRLYVDGDYAGVLSVLRYNSTSALLRYGGGMYGEGKLTVQIVGEKFTLTDPSDGTVYYQR